MSLSDKFVCSSICTIQDKGQGKPLGQGTPIRNKNNDKIVYVRYVRRIESSGKYVHTHYCITGGLPAGVGGGDKFNLKTSQETCSILNVGHATVGDSTYVHTYVVVVLYTTTVVLP